MPISVIRPRMPMPPAAMPRVPPVLLTADNDSAATIHWCRGVRPIGIIHASGDQTDEEQKREPHENSAFRTVP